jgi:hypothetical protein
VQRRYASRPAGIGYRVLAFDPSRDQRHFGLRLVDGNPRLQTRHDAQFVRRARWSHGVQAQRDPDLAMHVPRRKMESRRHYPDHRQTFAVDANAFACNLPIASITLLP